MNFVFKLKYICCIRSIILYQVDKIKFIADTYTRLNKIIQEYPNRNWNDERKEGKMGVVEEVEEEEEGGGGGGGGVCLLTSDENENQMSED